MARSSKPSLFRDAIANPIKHAPLWAVLISTILFFALVIYNEVFVA